MASSFSGGLSGAIGGGGGFGGGGFGGGSGFGGGGPGFNGQGSELDNIDQGSGGLAQVGSFSIPGAGQIDQYGQVQGGIANNQAQLLAQLVAASKAGIPGVTGSSQQAGFGQAANSNPFESDFFKRQEQESNTMCL